MLPLEGERFPRQYSALHTSIVLAGGHRRHGCSMSTDSPGWIAATPARLSRVGLKARRWSSAVSGLRGDSTGRDALLPPTHPNPLGVIPIVSRPAGESVGLIAGDAVTLDSHHSATITLVDQNAPRCL